MNKIFKWLKSLGQRGEVNVVAAPPSGAIPPGSASAPVVLPKAGDGTPPVTPPAFEIPAAYRDKPYVKGIDNSEKLWAMLDGAETKLGQRPAGIPADNASPEEWTKFWRSLGAPEKPEEYQFDYGKDDKGQPKTAPDAEIETSLKQMLHKHGIPAKTAMALQKDFDAIAQGIIQKKGLAEQAINKQFDEIAKGVYGAEYDKMVQRVAPLLQEFTAPQLKPGLAKLSPEGLAILSSVVDNLRAKFIKADSAPGTPPGGGATVTPDAMRAEARQLMATEAYTNPFHAEHDRTIQRVNELYQKATGQK